MTVGALLAAAFSCAAACRAFAIKSPSSSVSAEAGRLGSDGLVHLVGEGGNP